MAIHSFILPKIQLWILCTNGPLSAPVLFKNVAKAAWNQTKHQTKQYCVSTVLLNRITVI